MVGGLHDALVRARLVNRYRARTPRRPTGARSENRERFSLYGLFSYYFFFREYVCCLSSCLCVCDV